MEIPSGNQIDGLSGRDCERQGSIRHLATTERRPPRTRSARGGDDCQRKTEKLLVALGDDQAVRETRFRPDPDPVATVGFTIEEGAVVGIEADIPRGDVPGKPVYPQIASNLPDGGQPLTAPWVKPPMMWRWAKRNVRTIGKAPSRAAAAMFPHLAE